MNELPQNPGYVPESDKLAPELVQVGVQDVDQEHAKHLEVIKNHLAEANTTVGEKTPIVEPHPDSVSQVEHPNIIQFPVQHKRPDITTHAGKEAIWKSIQSFFAAFKHPSRFWRSANSVTNTISVTEINKIRGEEPFPQKAPDNVIPFPGSNDSQVEISAPEQVQRLPDNVIPFPGTSPQESPSSIANEEEVAHAA